VRATAAAAAHARPCELHLRLDRYNQLLASPPTVASSLGVFLPMWRGEDLWIVGDWELVASTSPSAHVDDRRPCGIDSSSEVGDLGRYPNGEDNLRRARCTVHEDSAGCCASASACSVLEQQLAHGWDQSSSTYSMYRHQSSGRRPQVDPRHNLDVYAWSRVSPSPESPAI
jgi:hypothetical protein